MDEKILIVEDDPDIADLLELNLRDAGYRTELAKNGLDGARMALENDFDLVCLDIMLPKLDGMEVLKRIREEKKTLPVLMLTAKSEEFDKVLGLELGADDYIIKPFDPAEVVARIRARLRKGRTESDRQAATATFAGWTAYFDRYLLVGEAGEEVPFSHAEGEVLRLFLDSPKRLISRAQMQELLGGAAGESFDRAMDVRISRLRTKLGEDPKNPRLIKTIYGAGYIFLGDVRWR